MFSKRPKLHPEAIMNEAPSVIGMMSVTLSSGGSFDRAIREIAKSGPENISKIFGRIVLDADCRVVCDIKKEIMLLKKLLIDLLITKYLIQKL